MATRAVRTVTMADVAAKAGVTKATVSYVLGGKSDAQMISHQTRRRILRIAEEIGYQTRHAARALASGRTDCIGFILSDRLPRRMAEYVCSYCIPGLEQACRNRGFALLVSTENLSDPDSFVIPRSIGQRRVDGLIFIHIDNARIVEKFLGYRVPCVCLGNDAEIGRYIPMVDADLIGGWLEALRYAARLGHRRVGFITQTATAGDVLRVQDLAAAARRLPETQSLEVRVLPTPADTDWSALERVSFIDIWQSMAAGERPTLLMGPEHVLPHVLQDMYRRHLHCPGDLSLIATGNANPILWTAPPLTAVDVDLSGQIETAVNLLIDHLQDKRPLGPELSRDDLPCRLLIRESCAPLPKERAPAALDSA